MIRSLLAPVLLAGSLAACASNAVNPGIVNTSTGGPVSQATANNPAIGASGRVVQINEVALRGAGGGRSSGNGAMQGGLIGAAGGSVLGAVVSNTIGGSLVGLVLGAVGGAIAGSIADSQGGSGPGIEVTVQTDNGPTVTVAQRDDGDVQLGDRVQIVQDGRGVARAVRDNSRTYDPSQQQNNYPPQSNNTGGNYAGNYPPQNYPQQGNYPPQGNYGRNYPPQQNYYPAGSYPPANSGGPYGSARRVSGNPAPQDDPRLGTLN